MILVDLIIEPLNALHLLFASSEERGSASRNSSLLVPSQRSSRRASANRSRTPTAYPRVRSTSRKPSNGRTAFMRGVSIDRALQQRRVLFRLRQRTDERHVGQRHLTQRIGVDTRRLQDFDPGDELSVAGFFSIPGSCRICPNRLMAASMSRSARFKCRVARSESAAVVLRSENRCGEKRSGAGTDPAAGARCCS